MQREKQCHGDARLLAKLLVVRAYTGSQRNVMRTDTGELRGNFAHQLSEVARAHLADAETLLREQLELCGGEDHGDEDILLRTGFATLLRFRGELAEAEKLLRQVVEMLLERLRTRAGPRCITTLNWILNLAKVLEERGDIAGAEKHLHEVMQAAELLRAHEGEEAVQVVNRNLELG